MSTDAGLEHDPVIRVPRGQRQILYLILTDRSADIRSRWIKYRSAAADFDRRAHRTQLERAVHHCFTACLEDDFTELERGEPVLALQLPCMFRAEGRQSHSSRLRRNLRCANSPLRY